MVKLIGITTSIENHFFKLNRLYCDAVVKAGGVPVLLPPVAESEIAALLAPLDGVILSGGGDIHFDFLHEPCMHPLTGSVYPERDTFELAICRYTLSHNIKTLGICRGMQIMAVGCGGALIQHIEKNNHVQGELARDTTFHSVYIRRDTTLMDIYGLETMSVNSFHHQAVVDAGQNMHAAAYAYDETIAALEHKTHKFFVGVQWHPECLLDTNPQHVQLFHSFVAQP